MRNELHHLYIKTNVIRIIKPRRIRWEVNAARKREERRQVYIQF